MKTALQKEILTETYLDMDNLICDIVWKFIKRYGGEFDELKAEANFLFISAVESYQKTKGKLTTWLHHRIWRGLQDSAKTERAQTHFELYEELVSDKHHSNLFLILNELGDDGRTIIKIIFEPPEGITDKDLETGFKSYKTRMYLKNYLSSKLGWTGKRIKESFTEIRQIIND